MNVGRAFGSLARKRGFAASRTTGGIAGWLATTVIALTGLLASPAHSQILLEWALPAERINGEPLAPDEIAWTYIYCDVDEPGEVNTRVASVEAPQASYDIEPLLPPGTFDCGPRILLHDGGYSAFGLPFIRVTSHGGFDPPGGVAGLQAAYRSARVGEVDVVPSVIQRVADDSISPLSLDPVGAGNTIIVLVRRRGATDPSQTISDSEGGEYTLDWSSPVLNNLFSNIQVFAYRRENVQDSPTSITPSDVTGGGASEALAAYEISGSGWAVASTGTQASGGQNSDNGATASPSIVLTGDQSSVFHAGFLEAGQSPTTIEGADGATAIQVLNAFGQAVAAIDRMSDEGAGSLDVSLSTSRNSSFFALAYEQAADPGGETVEADLTVGWAVRQQVLADSDVRWSLLARIGAEIDLQWPVRELVAADPDLRWSIREAVAADADLQWPLMQRVAPDVDLQWDIQVRVAVAAVADLQWATRERVVAEADAQWSIRERVGSPIELIWDVIERVHGDIDLRWRIGALVVESPNVLITVDTGYRPITQVARHDPIH